MAIRRDSKGFLQPILDSPWWTPTTRQQHSRPVTRYQTDLTDAEWRDIAPHLPKPSATGRPAGQADARDRQRHLHVMRAGARRLLPNNLPPWGRFTAGS